MTRAAVALAFATAAGAAAAAVVSNGTGAPQAHRSHRTTASAPGSSAASAPPPTTTAPAARRNLTIAAVGDTMLGSTPVLPPSPGTYLGAVDRLLRGDLVFGNLEGTLTDSTSGKCAAGSTDCFAFRAPPAFARDLRTSGFTLMSNANNHSYDFGQAGEDETVRALHAAGVAQTGLPGEITIIRAGG